MFALPEWVRKEIVIYRITVVHDGIALLRDKVIVSYLPLRADHVLCFLRNPIIDLYYLGPGA